MMLHTKLLLVVGLLLASRQVICQESLENGDAKDNCQATRQGCTCEFFWEFSSLEYIGCNNPDKDPTGLWCMVNIDSCDKNSTEQVLKQQIQQDDSNVQDVQYYDYCNPKCPAGSGFPEFKDECRNGNQTLTACSCLDKWTLIIAGEIKSFDYCENPDNDPGGRWCKIDKDQSCDFVELTARNQLTRNGQTNEILSYWDYCSQECGGLVRPETFMDGVDAPTQQSTGSSGSAPQLQGSSSSSGSVGIPMPSPIPYLPTAVASPVSTVIGKVSNEGSSSSSKGSQSSAGFTGSG